MSAYIDLTPQLTKPHCKAEEELQQVGSQRFHVCGEVGSGAFGCVFRCLDTQHRNRKVAVKMLSRNAVKSTEKLRKEVDILRSVTNHFHIVGYHEFVETPNFLGIVMEYVAGGDLHHYISSRGRLAETEARWLFQQLVIATDWCHRKDIAIRDLKPDNVLLSGKQAYPLLKLCDFGLSKNQRREKSFSKIRGIVSRIYTRSLASTSVGTLDYMAPEVLTSRNRYRYDGTIADMWSLGCILFAMLYGKLPFVLSNDRTPRTQRQQAFVMRLLTDTPLEIPGCPEVSSECKDLLEKLLVRNPKRRLTINKVRKHPWFLRNLPPGAETLNDKYELRHMALAAARSLSAEARV